MINKIIFSKHSQEQMLERGASREEVIEALYKGEKIPAKKGRHAYRLNFQYDKSWGGKYFLTKQVMPVVKEEAGRYVIITVYTFYF